MLTFVNTNIWHITDKLKLTDYTHTNYAYNSYLIFEFNIKRYRIKSFFNLLSDSNIIEQKNHSTSSCRVHIDNILTFYNKLLEINYLSINFDTIFFDNKYEENIKLIFKQPNFIFDNYTIINNNIYLCDLNINEKFKYFYDFETISYISGGYLGDLIHNLSIPYEIFKKTGRRAIIYLGNQFPGGHNFRYDLDTTFNDIYEIISKQCYIKELKI
jgi:hypothetical protein